MNNIDYIHNQDYQLRDNILIECSQEKAINSNYVYDWTCETGEINIKMGDEIMIYQSFLNVKGASNETINILDEEVNGNNPAKTPIEIQYYKCNDGLNSLPMPYSFQLLSMGSEEPDIENINEGFYKPQGDGSNSCIGSGMYVGSDCSRNIIGSGTDLMILSDLLRPIDCSRYTLMEQYIDEDAVYNETPRIKHRIFTGSHTINLQDGYYTPSNLCDNITKSITNPTINKTIDEFDRDIGLDITNPCLFKHKGLYRSRLDYGGIVIASAISGSQHEYNYYNRWLTGSYLSKSLWGWDLVNTVKTNETFGSTTWYFGGSFETDIKNAFPRVADDWFRPAPSWDFYGGTDRFSIGNNYKSSSPISNGTLSSHLSYYYKYPQSVIEGEKVFNRSIRQSFSRGGTGIIESNYTYNTTNITLFHNLVNTAYNEGVYDDIKVRKYFMSSGGTSQITLNKDTQRALVIAKVNPDNTIFGTQSDNYYYGFPTNKFGHIYGCDLGGIGSSTASYTGGNAWQLMVGTSSSSKFKHSIQNTLGSFISNIQLIKYDATNVAGSGICVNSNGYIGFVVGSEEGGFIVTDSGNHHIGWFPKHSDGLFNSSICHINPHGLGYKPFNRRINGKLTGGTFTTQIQPLQLSGGDHANFAPSNITQGTSTQFAKSHNSSNPNVYVGALSPTFSFDTDLSRFTISDLYTPEYISNSVYATAGNPNTDGGSSVVYLNPIFQETHNQFIDKWENWSITGTGLFKPLGHRTFFNNADRNRNTIVNKGVSIMDANMGIYISKWANVDTEDAWDSSLWSKMGFSYETLHPPNNRHFRNEDYTIGTTITLSNPSTTNANFDVSLMNQFTTNLYNFPIYEIGACGEVLQREISAPSSQIVADKLPIKNELPYYIICSDILSYGGMNQYRQGGNPLPAIDICSLNYNSEDYYFAEPSQLTHIADKDLNINSINIVVRRPDGRLATELSGKSSVILKISRNYTLPPIQMDDIGDKLQELNKNTEKLPPQITGGVLKASGGTLMGGKITTDAINSFRTLTNLGITGEIMEAIQGTEPELYSEMLEQADNNEANEIRVYEELRNIQDRNIILEAQIRSNRQTLRDYELEIQRDTEERQMIPRLREQVRNQELQEDYNRNVERLNRIYAEMPNNPAQPIPVNNLPSTPNLQTQITYDNIDREETGRISPSQISLPDLFTEDYDEGFDEAVETDNTTNRLQSIIVVPTEQQVAEQRLEERLSTPLRSIPETQQTTPTDIRERIQTTRELDRELDEYMGRTEQPIQIQPTSSSQTQSSNPVSSVRNPSVEREIPSRLQTETRREEDTERRQEPQE